MKIDDSAEQTKDDLSEQRDAKGKSINKNVGKRPFLGLEKEKLLEIFQIFIQVCYQLEKTS